MVFLRTLWPLGSNLWVMHSAERGNERNVLSGPKKRHIAVGMSEESRHFIASRPSHLRPGAGVSSIRPASAVIGIRIGSTGTETGALATIVRPGHPSRSPISDRASRSGRLVRAVIHSPARGIAESSPGAAQAWPNRRMKPVKSPPARPSLLPSRSIPLVSATPVVELARIVSRKRRNNSRRRLGKSFTDREAGS